MHLTDSTRRLAPLLGYGFLYAWGYLCWITPALGTEVMQLGRISPVWLASACATPALLLVLTALGAKRDLERYPLAECAVVAGAAGVLLASLLPLPALALVGGALMGASSALFAISWALTFSHYDAGTVETAIPLSFVVSLACTLVSPRLPRAGAVALAAILAVACYVCLRTCQRDVREGRLGELAYDRARDVGDSGQYGNLAIARMLAFSTIAWATASLELGFCGLPGWVTRCPVDVVSLAGFAAAVAASLLIGAFSVRVDFQALARAMTIPMIASVALAALVDPAAQLVANMLNVAVSSTFEVVLVLFFVRVAQLKGSRTGMWVSMGTAAAYVGVLVGPLLGALVPRDASALLAARLCLLVVCVYVAATALIPQRRPFEPLPHGKAPQPSTWGTQSPEVASPTRAQAVGTPVRADEQAPASLPSAAVEPAPAAGPTIDAACRALADEFGLTPREEQVCALLAHGRTQTYIRDALFLSKSTVSTLARQVYE